MDIYNFDNRLVWVIKNTETDAWLGSFTTKALTEKYIAQLKISGTEADLEPEQVRMYDFMYPIEGEDGLIKDPNKRRSEL